MKWMPIETVPRDGTRVLLCGGEIDDDHWWGHVGPVVAAWNTRAQENQHD